MIHIVFSCRISILITISQYEKTGKLSKKKYELIFDSLFGDTLLSKDEFIEMISNVGNLISQDEKYDVSELEPEDTDLFMSVLRNMRNDMVHSHSTNIYRYINIMTVSYTHLTLPTNSLV